MCHERESCGGLMSVLIWTRPTTATSADALGMRCVYWILDMEPSVPFFLANGCVRLTPYLLRHSRFNALRRKSKPGGALLSTITISISIHHLARSVSTLDSLLQLQQSEPLATRAVLGCTST